MAPIHTQVLAAARRICGGRSGWTFTPLEVVKALPHLNERSVRTHIVSRCCVNAPNHHQTPLEYFERTARRGVYEIRVPFREAAVTLRETPQRTGPADQVGESAAAYAVDEPDTDRRDTVHAVIVQSQEYYVAECLEVAVVTQGRSLDETVANLRGAIGLHLSSSDALQLGLPATPRLVISYEP